MTQKRALVIGSERPPLPPGRCSHGSCGKLRDATVAAKRKMAKAPDWSRVAAGSMGAPARAG